MNLKDQEQLRNAKPDAEGLAVAERQDPCPHDVDIGRILDIVDIVPWKIDLQG